VSATFAAFLFSLASIETEEKTGDGVEQRFRRLALRRLRRISQRRRDVRQQILFEEG
jgi:hypothetical protein